MQHCESLGCAVLNSSKLARREYTSLRSTGVTRRTRAGHSPSPSVHHYEQWGRMDSCCLPGKYTTMLVRALDRQGWSVQSPGLSDCRNVPLLPEERSASLLPLDHHHLPFSLRPRFRSKTTLPVLITAVATQGISHPLSHLKP